MLLLALFAATACGQTGDTAGDSAATGTDVSRVLVITAMPIELQPLLEAAEIARREIINGRTHHVGTLEGADVVLLAAGISMVNATMGTQVALDHFVIEAVVFSGIAGGASPDINIGEGTVPGRWAQYQEHVFTDASRAGWRRGWRSEALGSFGMMYPQQVRATAANGEADTENLKLWFDVDAELLARVEGLAASVTLERCGSDGDCLDYEPIVRVGGNGVSGPTFVDDAAYRDWVWETFAPDGFDMETAAVGHVAYANGVPYIGIRSISDMAGANPNENRVESFAPIAARNAAIVVRALLRDLR
jgi:adenosylhomocysteine nucleosidase